MEAGAGMTIHSQRWCHFSAQCTKKSLAFLHQPGYLGSQLDKQQALNNLKNVSPEVGKTGFVIDKILSNLRTQASLLYASSG